LLRKDFSAGIVVIRHLLAVTFSLNDLAIYAPTAKSLELRSRESKPPGFAVPP